MKYWQSRVIKKHDLSAALELFYTFTRSIMIVSSANDNAWLLAEDIVKSGHSKSGFLSIHDSVYNALAIHKAGVFLTADKKHYDKSKKLEHITLLKDWESIFMI